MIRSFLSLLRLLGPFYFDSFFYTNQSHWMMFLIFFASFLQFQCCFKVSYCLSVFIFFVIHYCDYTSMHKQVLRFPFISFACIVLFSYFFFYFCILHSFFASLRLAFCRFFSPSLPLSFSLYVLSFSLHSKLWFRCFCFALIQRFLHFLFLNFLPVSIIIMVSCVR